MKIAKYLGSFCQFLCEIVCYFEFCSETTNSKALMCLVKKLCDNQEPQCLILSIC